MVLIFGNDYSLTIVLPFVLIIIMLVFFLATYIRDNIKILKFKPKRKKEKKEIRAPINFNQEFRILKKEVTKSSTHDSLNSISSLTKKYIGDKLNLTKQFSFEELPRDKLQWQVIELTKRISDLKYSGKEISKSEIDHLLVYLSKILKFKSIEEHEPKEAKVPNLSLPRFFRLPKIEFRLPKRKHKVDFVPKPHKPINLGPKKIRINLSNLFKKTRKKLKDHEVLEEQKKVISLINKIRNNIENTDKALKYCEKAININKILPKHRYSKKLLSLRKEIIRTRDNIAKNKELEIKKEIALKKEKEFFKIRKKVVDRIKFAQENVENYNKSLLSYKKSFQLSKSLPKGEFKSELKTLYQNIISERKRQILLIQQAQEDQIKQKQHKKQLKLKLIREKENAIKQSQLEEKQRRLRLIREKENAIKQRKLEKQQRRDQKKRDRRQREIEKQKQIFIEQQERERIRNQKQKDIRQREIEKQKIIELRNSEIQKRLELKRKIKEREIKQRQLEIQRKVELKKEIEREKRRLEKERQKQIRLEDLEREKQIVLRKKEKEREIRKRELEKQRIIELRQEEKQKQLQIKKKIEEDKLKLEHDRQRQERLREIEKRKEYQQKKEAELKRIKTEQAIKLKEIKLKQELKEKEIKRERALKQRRINEKEAERNRKLELKRLNEEKKLKLRKELIKKEQEEKEREAKLREEEKERKLKNHVLEYIKLAEQNITNTNKALRYYNKAVKLKRNVKVNDFSQRLNDLHKNMLATQENRIKLEQKAKLRAVKESQEAEERKIEEKKKEIRLKEREVNRKIKLKKLNEEKKLQLKEETRVREVGSEIFKLISHAEQNLDDTNKALKYYNKADELSKSIHKHSSKLKVLHQAILDVHDNKIKLKREAEQKKLRLIHEEKVKIEKQKQRELRLKEVEKQKKVKLEQGRELMKLETKLLKYIKLSEQDIINSKPKRALRYYKTALDLKNSSNLSSHIFNERLSKIHKRIIDFQQKPEKISLPKAELPKPINYLGHKKQTSFLDRIKVNKEAAKTLELIKKAEKLALKYPLISRKYYNQALIKYYHLPVDKEEEISAKLSSYYDQVNGKHEKELLNIKHTKRKQTQEALKHLKKYRNYIVIENNSLHNNLKRSIYEIKKQIRYQINITQEKEVKSKLINFLSEIKQKEQKIQHLDKKAINRLMEKANSLIKTTHKQDSLESQGTNHSVKNMFSHLKLDHKLPKIKPLPKVEKKIKIEPPKEVKIIKKKIINSKIKIDSPKLPERKISERMKRLSDEKEELSRKLNNLGGQDRYKQSDSQGHHDRGYRNFLASSRLRSNLHDHKKIKRLFNTK